MDFTPNLVEIWTLYGVGTLMIAARIFVRTKMVGIRGYSPDDYLVWLAWVSVASPESLACDIMRLTPRLVGVHKCHSHGPRFYSSRTGEAYLNADTRTTGGYASIRTTVLGIRV